MVLVEVKSPSDSPGASMRDRKARAVRGRAAGVLFAAAVLNFVVFMVGYYLALGSGTLVGRGQGEQPYVIQDHNRFVQVGPATYVYVKAHEALTFALILAAIAAGAYTWLRKEADGPPLSKVDV